MFDFYGDYSKFIRKVKVFKLCEGRLLDAGCFPHDPVNGDQEEDTVCLTSDFTGNHSDAAFDLPVEQPHSVFLVELRGIPIFIKYHCRMIS